MTAREIIKAGLYESAVELMDDEIRERLHSEIAPCSDEEFLEAYIEEHEKKYAADFVI